MMLKEFERLAGYEVSAQDYYDIIEPMYMATKLTKEEFVKVIDKKRFRLRPYKEMIRLIKKEAQYIKKICPHYIDEAAEDRLDDLVEELDRRFPGGWNIEYGIRWSCYYPKYLTHCGNRIEIA